MYRVLFKLKCNSLNFGLEIAIITENYKIKMFRLHLVLILVLFISTISFAQEVFDDGYYTLSSNPDKDSYLYISTDSAVLHWIDSDEIFHFTFENFQEVTYDNGLTEYKYSEPEGYSLYPSFAYSKEKDGDMVKYDIEFKVFDKKFKKEIGGTKYYEYGSWI